MKTTTWIAIIGTVVVVTVAAVFASGKLSSGIPVETGQVARGPIREFVDERAVTRLPETYLVTMPYPGRIDAITLTEGDRVEGNNPQKPVARCVPVDLELAVEEARAVVDRLDAAIVENLDDKMERLAKQQADQFVLSMIDTVKSAAERVKSGQARYEYSERNMGRVAMLRETGASTADDLERAELEKVTGEVDFAQDKLVLSITEALKLATDIVPTMVQQFISDKTLTDAVLKKERAEAATRLQQVELNQQRGTLPSPVDGVVLKRFVSDQRYLAAGEPLLEIGRLEDLQIEVDVLSLDVVQAKPGDPVEIYGPAIGTPPARGTLAKIYPAGFTKISSLGVEQQRVKVIVQINPQDLARLREERNLGVGYRVRVKIITAEKSDALVVPRSALFRGKGGKWQLYAVRDGRATLLEDVQVGMINDQLAEVLAGVAQGEQIIRAPESSLTDGQRVRVEDGAE
jgi:HlyD family secretion protein